MARLPAKSSRERGAALVEFAFSAVIWVPMLLGAMVFGFNLVRAVDSSQICRDAAHMFAYGVDFTQSTNQAILARLCSPINVISGNGDGVIVLSKITLVTQLDCNMSTNGCANLNQYVFTSFYTFGNAAAVDVLTRLGNPPTTYVTGATAITQNDIFNNTSLRASNLPSSLQFLNTTKPGQLAYAAELSLRSPASYFPGFTSTGSYVRSFF